MTKPLPPMGVSNPYTPVTTSLLSLPSPYQNSGLARFSGLLDQYIPPAYTPRTYQAPSLGLLPALSFGGGGGAGVNTPGVEVGSSDAGGGFHADTAGNYGTPGGFLGAIGPSVAGAMLGPAAGYAATQVANQMGYQTLSQQLSQMAQDAFSGQVGPGAESVTNPSSISAVNGLDAMSDAGLSPGFGAEGSFAGGGYGEGGFSGGYSGDTAGGYGGYGGGGYSEGSESGGDSGGGGGK